MTPTANIDLRTCVRNILTRIAGNGGRQVKIDTQPRMTLNDDARSFAHGGRITVCCVRFGAGKIRFRVFDANEECWYPAKRVGDRLRIAGKPVNESKRTLALVA